MSNNKFLFFADKRKTGNIAIESFIIGKDINKWRHEFIDNETTPHCDINGKVIYSPMFGTLVDEHDDTIVRAKNEHEAGHARYTSCNKKEEWSELKSNIVNSLEDLRIEKNISCLSDMICYDLNYLNNDLSLSIGKKISQCNNIKPINEALLAMQLKENGNSILWKISDKAQEYIDNVYSEYKKWKNIKNFDNKFGTKENFSL